MPQVGQTTPTRWIDTGSEMNGFDNHVYLSEIAIREAAAMFGMVPGVQVKDRDVLIEKLRVKCDEIQAELELALDQLHAIDVIESADFRARKKTGRPKREMAA
jgi:hypothetical protein